MREWAHVASFGERLFHSRTCATSRRGHTNDIRLLLHSIPSLPLPSPTQCTKLWKEAGEAENTERENKKRAERKSVRRARWCGGARSTTVRGTYSESEAVELSQRLFSGWVSSCVCATHPADGCTPPTHFGLTPPFPSLVFPRGILVTLSSVATCSQRCVPSPALHVAFLSACARRRFLLPPRSSPCVDLAFLISRQNGSPRCHVLCETSRRQHGPRCSRSSRQSSRKRSQDQRLRRSAVLKPLPRRWLESGSVWKV